METQLRELIKQHNFSKAKSLIEKGIDVNETNSVNGTALMSAVLENSIEMVNFLLSAGACVNMCNNAHHTALSIAYETENNKISSLLRKYGAINPFDTAEKEIFIADFQSTKKKFLNFFESKNLLKNICGYNLILINDVAKKYLIKNRKKIQRYAKAEPIIMGSFTAINSSFFSILLNYIDTADNNTYILEENCRNWKYRDYSMSTEHSFNFEGGDILAKMGASWFVSYLYCIRIDDYHRNWELVSTANVRASSFCGSKQYHKLWLKEILKMNPAKLNTNTIDLSAEEVKKMASELLENWE